MAFPFDTVSFYRKTVLCRPFTFKRLVDKSTGTAGNPVSELTPAAAFTGEATKKASQGKAFQGETVVSNRVVLRWKNRAMDCPRLHKQRSQYQMDVGRGKENLDWQDQIIQPRNCITAVPGFLYTWSGEGSAVWSGGLCPRSGWKRVAPPKVNVVSACTSGAIRFFAA